jgi:hypothetical protein
MYHPAPADVNFDVSYLPSMNYPHFTIVIPTRNRLGTLKHAIRTCLDQDYDNFTVIVASNNCSDDTEAYVSSLNDSRVIQLVSNADLPMVANWSRVMPDAIALGGYVTYLGDDDGLLPGALSLAAKIIGSASCDVLSWRKVEYAWPDVLVEEYKNYFSISIDPVIVVKKSVDFLRGVHDYTCGYDEGPGLYSSFVSTTVLDALSREVEGGWFSAGSPDIYSSYVIASAVPEYHKCKFGLSVNGASGRSNGTAYMHRPQSDMAAEFKSQNTLHAALCHAPSVTIAESDALLVARERLPARFSAYEFSWPLLIQRLLDDIRIAPSEFHHDLLVTALGRVVTYCGLEQPEIPVFQAKPATEKLAPKYGIDLPGKRISANLGQLRVSDVYEASLFSNTIFPLGALQTEEILRETNDSATAELNLDPEVQNDVLGPNGRLEPIKRLGRPVVSRVRRYRKWVRNTAKIEKWFAREGDIARWMENEALIEPAIHSNEIRLEKERVAHAEFDEFKCLSHQTGGRNLQVNWDDRYLCLDEKTQETGFDRHYIYHPAWAARVLAKLRPSRHTDISSTLNFCTVVSAFIPVDFYDYRPAPLHLPGLNSLAANLVDLPFEAGSLESVSCMHVLEHVGLGRYGDPIDPNGDLQAIRELCRVVAPGGSLLIAVPIGEARVQFNAHRVYRHRDFLSYFEGLELVEFALIPDGAAPDGLVFSAPEHMVDAQKYGCGCYWFKKPARLG